MKMMTIDLPQCDLPQCRFCSNNRCRAQDTVRDSCEYNALRAQQQENKPLTLEELRGMRGDPVYITKGKRQWWDIVNFISEDWLYLRIANKTSLPLDDYGTKLFAYRRKPEE